MKAITISIFSFGLSLILLGNTAPQLHFAFDPAVDSKQTAKQKEQTTGPARNEKARANGEESIISQVCQNCRLAALSDTERVLRS